MGLDITAYSRLEADPSVSAQDCRDCEIDNWSDFATFYKEPTWASYAPEVKEDIAYRFGDEFGFRAGSYGGYSAFRDILAKIGGFNNFPWESRGIAGGRYKEPVDHLPFYHLVCFSDCEGTIGTAACVRLAKEFAENREKFAKEVVDTDAEYYLGCYDDWQKACELAANGGAISFH